MIPSIAIAAALVAAASGQDLPGFRARLLSETTKHFDLLMDANGKVLPLKGKNSASMTALAFYLTFEMTGNQRYRAAAVQLADRILHDMKATKFGVLYIKEKEKGAGKVIPGGGPPAFGWYTSTVAYIYHKEGGRSGDLKYIATVLDQYPWNEQGWWSADIDVKTGESKQPIAKPSPNNKNAAMALAAAMVGAYVENIDPAMSARLKSKADKCIYSQIIPAQEPDGFWHYGLTGNDPRNKDILGYFMITADALVQLRLFTDSYKDAAFIRALNRALAFAGTCIAPITDPNHGTPCASWTTDSTPSHYTLPDDMKRSFQLGLLLFAGGNSAEGMKIIDSAAKQFPYGNGGEDGAHAVGPSAILLRLLSGPLRFPLQ